MVIVKLMGGLGNQLFQYAAGYSLSVKNQTDLKVDFVAEGCTPRRYGLADFIISPVSANVVEVRKLRRSSLAKYFNWSKRTHFIESNIGVFQPQFFDLTGDIYLDGYWQSEKYFQALRNDLLAKIILQPALSITDLPITDLIKQSQSVAVHIRRGDYVSNERVAKVHDCCDLTYYQQAVELLVSKVKDPHFFIFSDDSAWVKDNFQLNYPMEYLSDYQLQDCQELILMSQCQHQIIANSSFSWWGAWLNQAVDKIVIAPKKWFNNPNLSQVDIVPETWLKI